MPQGLVPLTRQIQTINEEDAPAPIERLPRDDASGMPIGFLRHHGSAVSMGPSIRTNNSFAQSAESWSNQSVAASPAPRPRYVTNSPGETFVNEESSAGFPQIPSSFVGFQPSVPQSPNLSRVEQALHHHIDACFERLTKLITDKSDRVADTLHKRCDVLEDRIEMLSSSHELERISNAVDDMRNEVKECFTGALVAVHDSIDLVRSLEGRLGAVEKDAPTRGESQADENGTNEAITSALDQRAAATGRKGPKRSHQRSNTTGTVEGMESGRGRSARGQMNKQPAPNENMPQAAQRRGRNVDALGIHPAHRASSRQGNLQETSQVSSGFAFGQQDQAILRAVGSDATPMGQHVPADQLGSTCPPVVESEQTRVRYELPSFAISEREVTEPPSTPPPRQ